MGLTLVKVFISPGTVEVMGRSQSSGIIERGSRYPPKDDGTPSQTEINPVSWLIADKIHSTSKSSPRGGSRSAQTQIHIRRFEFSYHWQVTLAMAERCCSDTQVHAYVWRL